MTEQNSPDENRSGTKGASNRASSRGQSDGSPEFGAGLASGSSAKTASRKKGRSSGRKRASNRAKSSGEDSPEGTAKPPARRKKASGTGRSRPESSDSSDGDTGATRKKRTRRRSSASNDDGDRERTSEPDRNQDRGRNKERGSARSSERSPRRSRSESRDDRSEDDAPRRSRSRAKAKPEPIVGFAPDPDEEKPSRKSASKKRPARKRSRSKADDEEKEPESKSTSTRGGSRSKKATKKTTRRKSSRSRSKDDDYDEDDRDLDRGLDRDGDDERDSGRRSSKKTSKRKASKKKASTKRSKTPEELAEEEAKHRTKTIVVNAADPEERRVVLLGGDNRIEDLLMTAESQKNLVNDIYRGKVVNLETAIGAAFVDFGQGRNGFLHTSDVMPVYGEEGFTLSKLLTTRMEDDDGHPDVDDDEDEDEDASSKRSSKARRSKKSSKKSSKSSSMQRRSRQRLPISDLLKVGDQVVVQVTKDAIGDKGPTLTTYISIPGRYLVLMPSMARTGVSRKIPDDNERRRLKRILNQMDAPEEMGVIVRTAGVGKLKTDLKRDLNYLLGVWKTFESKLKTGRGPTPLYQESDVATRTLRDLFNKETKEVVVDDFAVHEQMVDFAERLMPEHVERIKHYKGDRPIFHDFGLEQDFEQIFHRSVELPSGGSIVFDQAEALVAIDVNSGRTRTNSNDFEEIALKTNLEAVPEIALQIRLRDLGGILVCDFIDMMKSSSNRAVERALRAELVNDRARSKMGRIGQFGLLELTRQRLGPGTHKKVFQACPRCRGTGRVRTVQSRAQAILRRLGSALTQKGFSTVEVRAHPEVVRYVKDSLWDYVRALEHRFEREIRFTEVPDQAEDSVLRYLRTDGREVRPGGRRKK